MDDPAWLTLARELQAIAQIGLTYTRDEFDAQRYERVRELAATIMAAGWGVETERIVDLFRHEVGYATPKVDIRGAAFRDGRIMLVREVSDRRWTLPGGWADVNQSAAECAVREIAEESGFEARAVKLAAVWDYARHGHVSRHPHSIYKIFFVCEITGGEGRAGLETSEVAFFPEDGLPELSLGRITAPQIRRMFEHWRRPELPADFD